MTVTDCSTCGSSDPKLHPVREDAPPTEEWIGSAEDFVVDCPDPYHSATDAAGSSLDL